jgi:uncharacterized membrane protein YozB (DUF420 family)
MHFSAMAVVRPRAMRFYLGLAVLMFAVVAVGFGPSLYLRRVVGTVDRFGPSLPPHLLAHGSVLTVWYVLFLVQTLLVRTGRRDIHRRLGVLGAAVSVAVVASSMITMRMLVARLGTGGGQLPPRVVFVVVSDFWVLVAFTLLVAAAVHFRRQPETHKRLMLLASVFLLGPALAIGRPIGRTLMPLLPNGLLPSTVFTLVSIGTLICYDVATKKRLEPATVWGSVAIGAAFAATRIMVSSPVGSAFARWLGGLGT